MTAPHYLLPEETGPAGLPVKPYKPRCNFGRSHFWISDGNESNDQCAACGCVSSEHPVSKGGDSR